MLSYMHLIFKVLHISFDLFGIGANSLLLFFLICKRPKHMGTYCILVINMSSFDLLTCVMDLLLQERIISEDDSILYISRGPCTYISSLFCYSCHNLLIHFFTHGTWIVFLSFIYRYRVLTQGAFDKKYLTIALMSAWSLSAIQFGLFQLTPGLDEDILDLVIRKIPNENMTMGPDIAFYGVVNVWQWNNLVASAHVTGLIYPMLIAEIILGRKVYKFLKSTVAMSKATKNMHEQLFKALACQCIIPVTFASGITLFALPRTGLPDFVILQYATFTILDLMPALSACFNLYFITAFRNDIKGAYMRLRGLSYKFEASVAPSSTQNDSTAKPTQTSPVSVTEIA